MSAHGGMMDMGPARPSCMRFLPVPLHQAISRSPTDVCPNPGTSTERRRQ